MNFMGLRRYLGRKTHWKNLTEELQKRGINCYQKEVECKPDLLTKKINERYQMCYKNPDIKTDSPLGHACTEMDTEINRLNQIQQSETCHLCDEYLRTKRMPSKKERKAMEKSGVGRYERELEETQHAEAMLPSPPKGEPSDSSQYSQQQVPEP